MTAPPSPSLLQPPPKRAAGVKRLNRVPIGIAVSVVAVFMGVVGYTLVQRSHKDAGATAEQATASKPQGAKPPGFLAAKQDHGEVQASLTKPLSRVTPVAARTGASTPTTNSAAAPAPATQGAPAQSGTDVDEQARTRAWATYYQQRDQLQAARFQMDLQARQGGNDPLQTSTGGTTQIPRAGGASEPGSGQQPPVAAKAPPYSTGGTDPEGQTGKQAFLRTKGDILGQDEDTPGGVHPPKPNTIMEGTAVPGRLVEGATSDSPGQLVAEVSTNVYDDMTGLVLLIPQWTRIVTTYDTAVSTGQERIGTIAQRLIFPDTSSRQLGSMQIADQSGLAGLKDIVRTHFWEKFWATAVISLAGAGAQLAQPQQSAFSGYSPSSVATGQLTQGFSQLGQSIAQKSMSIPNTIELRAGLPLVIKFKDLTLPPYVDHRDVSASASTVSVSLGRLVQ